MTAAIEVGELFGDAPSELLREKMLAIIDANSQLVFRKRNINLAAVCSGSVFRDEASRLLISSADQCALRYARYCRTPNPGLNSSAHLSVDEAKSEHGQKSKSDRSCP